MSKCEWCGERSRGTAIQDAPPYAVRLSCGNHGTDFTPDATEYPDWLVERVSIALHRSNDFMTGWSEWEELPEWAQASYHDQARAVLDALGFERRTGRGRLLDDSWLQLTWGFDSARDRDYEQYRAATEWKEVTDG